MIKLFPCQETGMKIKRFTARDLPTATNLIKDEFGLAALILSQRELPAEAGGGVEITAGVREEDLPLRVGFPGGPGVGGRPGRRAGPGFQSRSGRFGFTPGGQILFLDPRGYLHSAAGFDRQFPLGQDEGGQTEFVLDHVGGRRQIPSGETFYFHAGLLAGNNFIIIAQKPGRRAVFYGPPPSGGPRPGSWQDAADMLEYSSSGFRHDSGGNLRNCPACAGKF